MTLTIVIDEKSTQRINFSDKVFQKNDGKMKSTMEIEDMCKDIAHDITKGNYKSVKFN
jgi:hypothetical protein